MNDGIEKRLQKELRGSLSKWTPRLPVLNINGRWRWAVFPLSVLGILVALVCLDLNGSSIAAFSDAPARDGLLLGEPLGVRSDEYLLETPNAISSTQQGMPTFAWIGLANVDQAVAAGGGPALDWSTILKPQDWGFIGLGASQGLSWNWWWPFAVSLWGTFALFAAITKRATLAAALAVAATFTPYSAWWLPSLLVGYATLAGAAILGAWIARRTSTAALLSVGAGFAAGALAMVIYPPWQFSLALVIVTLCLGFALDRRIPWRRLLWTSGIAAVLAAATLLLWFYQHRDATAAVASTIYPGQRKTEAGGGSIAVLLDAPLNFWMVGDAGASLGTGGEGGQFSNLSEASSSWFPISVIILAMAGVVVMLSRIRHVRSSSVSQAQPVSTSAEPIWMLCLISALIALLLAWTFLPLPGWFGEITQLQRIQPSRTTLALGLLALLLISVATTVSTKPRLWSWPVLVAAALVGAALTVWSAENLPWDAALVPTALVAASGFLLAALFAVLLSGRYVNSAAALLAVYAFVSWSLVNPVQQGIAPLSHDPLAVELRRVADADENPRTLVFGDLATVARVRAAGFQSISGTTPYPDAELMSALAPQQEELWNNYAQYEWVPAVDGVVPLIERITGSMMRLTISPCDPIVSASADPGWVVSESVLEGHSCLTPITNVDGAGGKSLHLYRLQPMGE